VIAGVAALVIVLTSLGGGSSSHSSNSAASPPTPATARSRAAVKHTTTTHKQTAPRAVAPANAAETPVTVLNGTETTGLAHRVSGALQQIGYSQAAALAGRPPGSGQTTVVQYTAGHQSDAESVARVLSVSKAKPIEPGVSSLAGTAGVVVIVGADKANSTP
jgi:hypothetical protein